MNSDKKRFIKLGWELIEFKILYYQPPPELQAYAEEVLPTDEKYDLLEQEYLGLCRTLDKPNTVVHKAYVGFEDVKGEGMMEIDWNRKSVDCALQALYNKAGIPKELHRSFWNPPLESKKKRKKKCI
jgi:hypothetical protein